MLGAALLLVLLSLQPGKAGPAGSALAQADEPLLGERPVVVAADRLVCSLLGASKTEAGIRGKDTGGTVVVNGVVYWVFGDTALIPSGGIPNSIASSSDKDASDCIDLVPKQVDGRAAALLPRDASRELTVWPSGLEETSPGRVNFFYNSIVSDPVSQWRSAGIGIGSFDVQTLEAHREAGGELLWQPDQPMPSRTYADGEYVYVFLNANRQPLTTDVMLARVLKESAETPAAYEYWQPGDGVEAGHWISGVWDAEAGTWGPEINQLRPLWRQPGFHNGVEVAYNEFLDRWTAVYTTDFFGSVNIRTAPDITGPWDGQENVLVSCPEFHEPPHSLFVCYSGSQHQYYARDGGRTIYASYANSDAYQVFLHEIRLAAKVTQWTDGAGPALYLPSTAAPPAGHSPEGVAFYASDIPVPGFAPIHRWVGEATGEVRYGANAPSPPADFADQGVGFYAPVDAAVVETLHAPYGPVYRWTKGEAVRYSPLDLTGAGYSQQELAFYSPCPDSDFDSLSDCEESFIGTDAFSQDTDSDGCTDDRELQAPVRYGGGRDPLNYWDFFDTPGWNGQRDGIVTLADVSQIVARFGSRGDPAASPFAEPIPRAPAYHTAFDRGNPTPSARFTPADGFVGIGDISSVLSQYGHNCLTPLPP